MYGQIYKITNIINNKIYIGKTTKDIQVRFKEHLALSDKYHYNMVNGIKQRQSLLYPAIYKYGKGNFVGMGKSTICSKYGISMYTLNIFIEENNLYRKTYKRPDTVKRNRDEANKKRINK